MIKKTKILWISLFCLTAVISCEKEEAQEPVKINDDLITHTRAQAGGECERKAIIYREYIDCTKEGTGCKVECDDFASADAGLLSYLSSLDLTVNNTISLKNYISNLPYISQAVYDEIQLATTLYIVVTVHEGTTVYGVFNENDELVYAFSFD